MTVNCTFTTPFEILGAAQPRHPILFNSPHSGRVYPDAFLALSRLDARSLRRSEDAFVDLLFADVVSFGAPLMLAHFPRAYLDVNREPYELDPAMFEGRLPSYVNARSLRVAGGLGTIPRVVGDAQDIYKERLPAQAAIERIDTLYKPYHETLHRTLDHLQALFGFAVLVDCHSMPSPSLSHDDYAKADIVIGDRFGTSAVPVLTDLIETALRKAGYSVVRNRPYAGGFITEHYGQPGHNRHAVQIEIARRLYMDEKRIEPHAGLLSLKQDLNAMVAMLCDISLGAVIGRPMAAE